MAREQSAHTFNNLSAQENLKGFPRKHSQCISPSAHQKPVQTDGDLVGEKSFVFNESCQFLVKREKLNYTNEL